MLLDDAGPELTSIVACSLSWKGVSNWQNNLLCITYELAFFLELFAIVCSFGPLLGGSVAALHREDGSRILFSFVNVLILYVFQNLLINEWLTLLNSSTQ